MGGESGGYNLNDPLAKVLLPVPVTLCSACPVGLVPEGGMLSPGYNNDSTELKVKAATQPLLAPRPLNHHAKRGVTVRAGAE